MKFQAFGNKIVLRVDKGEEVVETVKKLCREQHILLGGLSGIGAANRITIGLFETETKKYVSKELKGEYEITSLLGNISEMNGEPYLHLHINLSDSRYHTFGGHLNEAWISGTCEIIIDKIEGKMDRIFDSNVGLNLLNIPD
ncbi:PPC domain-containing DNA-binding protein [Geosporobacter ferrireducens]|uniref:DNA-binding protein n=1 Tax=Geosporobacter ferrireducens TaxID=1424294 RepID=A0A1D8GJX7_9FIRM|nr:PPC domain-containing DNA-binding protein [Geosporobacter ferrireducens]AOT71213.1 DNA-binding protein [Geosporobacter ferrireducens]MTI58030.1 DNA-binding protein [Geosporobacter ferrireducens]